MTAHDAIYAGFTPFEWPPEWGESEGHAFIAGFEWRNVNMAVGRYPDRALSFTVHRHSLHSLTAMLDYLERPYEVEVVDDTWAFLKIAEATGGGGKAMRVLGGLGEVSHVEA